MANGECGRGGFWDLGDARDQRDGQPRNERTIEIGARELAATMYAGTPRSAMGRSAPMMLMISGAVTISTWIEAWARMGAREIYRSTFRRSAGPLVLSDLVPLFCDELF